MGLPVKVLLLSFIMPIALGFKIDTQAERARDSGLKRLSKTGINKIPPKIKDKRDFLNCFKKIIKIEKRNMGTNILVLW